VKERLKLTIAYDGGPFSGWQSQRNGNGVQDHLERAFQRVAGASVRVHGAGRTDAGVHALGQCAHVDVSCARLSPERWAGAVNANLPATIRVMNCVRANADFHAQFSAREKTYRYLIWNAPVLPPLEIGRAWHIRDRLDENLMLSAAEQFVGRHDFAAFAANRGQAPESTVRTITRLLLRRRGARIVTEISGDGFLYKMVRMMVGLLVQIGSGERDSAEVARRLRDAKSIRDRARLVAPACGLTLVRIRYCRREGD
jgi:tRNA pseudouridine38-40 synthase